MLKALKETFVPPDPKELVRRWQANLRSQERALDRQIREIQVAEKAIHKSIKQAAARNDMGSAKALCREVINSRRAISRIATNKAQIMSVNHALVEQLAMLRVSQTLGKSSEVMQLVNNLMKIPEMQKNMMEMSKEMMKAGLIDEMISDSLDSTLDTEDMEEETDAQISQVLDGILGETLSKMPNVKHPTKVAAPQHEEPEEEEDDMEALRSRLDAIKN